MDNLTVAMIMGAITIISILGITKFGPKFNQNEADMFKKMSKLDKEYIKKLEDERLDLEEEIKSLKGSINRTQRGPKIEGKEDEWSAMLPELFENFSQFAPKWLKPFLGNKEIQSTLITKIQEDPEKYASIISKFIGKKATSEQEIEQSGL